LENRSIDSWLLTNIGQLGSGMKVAAVDQGEDQHLSLAVVYFVADDGGILSINHGNGLLDTGFSDLITESGNRIDPKLL
jgi:hypothetical protein